MTLPHSPKFWQCWPPYFGENSLGIVCVQREQNACGYFRLGFKIYRTLLSLGCSTAGAAKWAILSLFALPRPFLFWCTAKKMGSLLDSHPELFCSWEILGCSGVTDCSHSLSPVFSILWGQVITIYTQEVAGVFQEQTGDPARWAQQYHHGVLTFRSWLTSGVSSCFSHRAQSSQTLLPLFCGQPQEAFRLSRNQARLGPSLLDVVSLSCEFWTKPVFELHNSFSFPFLFNCL